jgi:hypothetical protein
MKKILLATVTVLGFSGTGHAFNNPALTPIEPYTQLECVPTLLQPDDHSRNPVYKTMVDLQRDSDQVQEFNVRHVLVDGTVVDRTNQYGNATVWQKKGYNEWYWHGTLNRNPKLNMTGRLYREARGQWVYEELLRNGTRSDFFMAAKCHLTD